MKKKTLIFCFLKCFVDMSQRPDRIRLGKESVTGSAQVEKVAQRPPQAQPSRRRQGGGTRIIEVMMWRGRRHRRVRSI